jgi:hypothetical protein
MLVTRKARAPKQQCDSQRCEGEGDRKEAVPEEEKRPQKQHADAAKNGEASRLGVDERNPVDVVDRAGGIGKLVNNRCIKLASSGVRVSHKVAGREEEQSDD